MDKRDELRRLDVQDSSPSWRALRLHNLPSFVHDQWCFSYVLVTKADCCAFEAKAIGSPPACACTCAPEHSQIRALLRRRAFRQAISGKIGGQSSIGP